MNYVDEIWHNSWFAKIFNLSINNKRGNEWVGSCVVICVDSNCRIKKHKVPQRRNEAKEKLFAAKKGTMVVF